MAYDCSVGVFASSSGFYARVKCVRECVLWGRNCVRTHQHALNSFWRTGFSVGTACHWEVEHENARTDCEEDSNERRIDLDSALIPGGGAMDGFGVVGKNEVKSKIGLRQLVES